MAIAELGAGLALLFAPGLALDLLLAVASSSPEALVVGRVSGAALLAIGVACWLGRFEVSPNGPMAVVAEVLVYNWAVAAILAAAGTMSQMAGVLLWPAVVFHAGLGIWSAVVLSGIRIRFRT